LLKQIFLTAILTMLFFSTSGSTSIATADIKLKTIESKQKQKAYIDNALLSFYNEWKNVKYKFGGESKRGIDCSAFTQKAFKEKFHLDIPRTARTQVKIGKAVKKRDLKLGDLVFFKTSKTNRHVGIYMGDGTFMHASIKGVKFTNLNKPFYKKAYWTSRRVLIKIHHI
jgi:murein DD-endopeptidase / murein LD-carboxypeptidase